MTGGTLLAASAAAQALEAAQRIADEFVDKHGVAEVAVFGSVARGEAIPGSDIDLVAIYPDMDYSRRWMLQLDLCATAREIAGRDVDVWVTDWPEWKLRSSEVTLSFEHRILDDCIVLASQSTPYQHIRKTKIGLPMTDKEEIEGYLANCQTAINDIRSTMVITPTEREAISEEDEEVGAIRLIRGRIARLRKTAAAAAESIEHSLKLLLALEDSAVPKTHSALDLLNLLPDITSESLSKLLTQIEWERVRRWRQAGTYVDSWGDLELSETEVLEEIERYYNALIQILPFAVDEYETRYGTSIHTDILRKDLSGLDRHLTTLNLLTGQEKEIYETLSIESPRKLRWSRRRKSKQINPDQTQLPNVSPPKGIE